MKTKLVAILSLTLSIRVYAASTPLPEIESWLTGVDAVNHHLWQPVGTFYNGATSAAAKLGHGFDLRQLSFADRVAYQRAIEEVYWRHRIWPKRRPGPMPPLDAVMPQATIEQKVQDYVHHSELVEEEWQKPITSEQLQAEMERMAQHTKQPEVLRELFAALDNDPFVIAECLARPVLTERLELAAVEWRKEPLESWSATARDKVPDVIRAATANYTLPAISGQPSECIDDTWTATSTANAPKGRELHTAVWTGNEMIVWGGVPGYVNTGGRYNPSTDSWTATSTTNAPTGRYNYTAVWTGSQMIVWGGLNGDDRLNSGGIYNPNTDSWTATTTTNAPTARGRHTAVWTGTEMIVWGGYSPPVGVLNTGGRYNPSTDSWTATNTSNAPIARLDHTAVWTGSEMIVWGGVDENSVRVNTGGRYNPSTDSWTATATTNAPTGRSLHTAVWTGSEMIVWGGVNCDPSCFGFPNTGGRYNPSTDSWTATSTINAPTGRYNYPAVWTGSEMIVWGGADLASELNTGGRYNPGTDSWTATSTTNAPHPRTYLTAVWTGSEMIVWGGQRDLHFFDSGGRYCAQAGPPITLSGAGRKVGGINTVRLTWSGATSTDMDIYRDGNLIATTPNDGTYTDSTGDTGRARYTYEVCEADNSNCSNDATVTFRQ